MALEKNSKNEGMDPMVLSMATGGGSPQTPGVNKLLEKYLETAIQRQQQVIANEEQEKLVLSEKIRNQQINQARNAELQEKKRLKEEADQNRCPHTRLNTMGQPKSLMAGQRTGPGTWSFRCQDCGKQYMDLHSMPIHLRPQGIHIGGPLN